MSAKTISVIGVGNMGGSMALNLLARGYTVYVHDIDHAKVHFLCEKGAIALIECAQAAIKSIATIVCVVDAEQTQQVLLGERGLMQADAGVLVDHTVMLCPTIAPQDVARFANELAQRGVQVIDAPMSGGPARAQDGSMSLMIACKDAVFAQHEGLLRDLSSKVFRISEQPGDASRTKLVNNLLAASNLAAAAEAMALAERLGLNLQTTLDVIEQSSGQSWIGSDRMRRAITHNGQGDFAPRAHMTLLAKDSKLALRMAQAAGASNPIGEQAARAFEQALKEGWADLDDAALLKLYQP
jgi:L-threonate 2-dehydrogenase